MFGNNTKRKIAELEKEINACRYVSNKQTQIIDLLVDHLEVKVIEEDFIDEKKYGSLFGRKVMSEKFVNQRLKLISTAKVEAPTEPTNQ